MLLKCQGYCNVFYNLKDGEPSKNAFQDKNGQIDYLLFRNIFFKRGGWEPLSRHKQMHVLFYLKKSNIISFVKLIDMRSVTEQEPSPLAKSLYG